MRRRCLRVCCFCWGLQDVLCHCDRGFNSISSLWKQCVLDPVARTQLYSVPTAIICLGWDRLYCKAVSRTHTRTHACLFAVALTFYESLAYVRVWCLLFQYIHVKNLHLKVLVVVGLVVHISVKMYSCVQILIAITNGVYKVYFCVTTCDKKVWANHVNVILPLAFFLTVSACTVYLHLSEHFVFFQCENDK